MENKTGKYLKYAIGEIFLVIIGILIALQINNWNEQRKSNINLNDSLHSLIDELNKNLFDLKIEKNSIKKRIEGLNRIFNGNYSEKDLKKICSYFASDVNNRVFKNTYETMREEKSLRLIKSKELEKSIVDLYVYNLLDLSEFSEWHREFVRDNIDPYLIENIPVDENMEVDPNLVKGLLGDVKFINILTYQNQLYKSYLKHNAFTTEQCNSVLEKIKTYLHEN